MKKSNINVHTYINAVKSDDLASTNSGHDGNAFHLEWIPEKLHPIILAVQEHSNAPLGMASMIVNSVISMSIGKGIGIRNLEAGYSTLGNIQALIGMPSGSGKSAIGKAAFKAFSKCVDAALKKFRKEKLPTILAELEDVKQRIASMRGKGGFNGDEIMDFQKLIQTQKELEGFQQEPQFHMDDATIPAMENILEWNNGTGSLFTLDGRKALNNILGLSAYGSGQSVTAESIFLFGFSQDPLVTNRAGGRNVNVQRPCLSSCILAQPDKVEKAISHPELKDAGFLARQLIYFSNERKPKHKRAKSIPEDIASVWEGLIQELFEAYRIGDDTRSKDHTEWVYLSEDQSNIIWEYDKQVDEKICNGERTFLQETATRLPEQAVKIAIIHHAAMHGNRAHHTPIDDKTIINAINFIEWQFAGLQEVMADESEERDRKIIRKAIEYARNQDSRSIKPREMQQKKWVSNAEEATRLLDNADANFERVEKPRKDGKPGCGSVSYVLK